MRKVVIRLEHKCTRNVPKLFDETLVGHWLIPLGLIDMFPSIVLSCCILKNSCLIISFILKNGTSKDCLTNQNTIAEVKESMYRTSHKRIWGRRRQGGWGYLIHNFNNTNFNTLMPCMQKDLLKSIHFVNNVCTSTLFS